MRYILLFLSHLFLLCTPVMAQTDDPAPFSADRPGMATPPGLVAHRKFQLENGLQFTSLLDGPVHSQDFLFSSLLVRYGVLKWAELRLECDFPYNISTDSTGTTVIYGITPLNLGAKIKLFSQRGVIPNLSVMFNLRMPFWGTREFRPDQVAPSFYLLMSNDFAGNLNLSYNYGIAWDGITPCPTHFYAVCFDIHLHPKWDVYAEGYGFAMLHEAPEYFMDTGVAFRICENLQADLSFGGYLNAFWDYYQLNLGIAWRIMGRG